MVMKRSVTQPARPKNRSSLAGAASTANRYEYSACRCARRTSSVLRSFHTPLSRSSQCVDSHATASNSAAHQWKPISRIVALTPTTRSTNPPAMKSIEISSGGPIMPRSKSRASVRSVVSSARSRWAIPAGVTHTASSRSYRWAAIFPPRFAETSWCSGCEINSSVKVEPTITKGATSEASRVIESTSQPKPTDVMAGSVPRSTINIHQPMA